MKRDIKASSTSTILLNSTINSPNVKLLINELVLTPSLYKWFLINIGAREGCLWESKDFYKFYKVVLCKKKDT